MRKLMATAGVILALICSCTMKNPLLEESSLPYGAPQFDKIKTEHYLPAFTEAIDEAKAEIDEITLNPEPPTFANTIEAMEFGGEKLNKVSSIFYNLMEADTNEELQNLAEQISPMMTDFSMYVSLNEKLFERVNAIWEQRQSLGLEKDQMRLLEKSYKGFVRSGAKLSDEDKKTFSKLNEEISLLQLQFSKNSLAAKNAFELNLTDEADLEGLPQFVRDLGAQTAKEKGEQGWTYTLSAPSYGPFIKYSSRRDLREKIYRAYNTTATTGEYDNTELCKQIVQKRLQVANLLGYKNYADYVVEERMVGSTENVFKFLDELFVPSMAAAEKEVAELYDYAKANGFEDSSLKAWDFSWWTEKYRDAKYSLSDEMLKPYFQLENCIDAVFGLATTLYGITFEECPDIPGYHKDVKVYDVKDEQGKHLALFYCDFFPRESKRSGAWMTEFRGQSINDGVERRPFVSLVCNFSKPTDTDPSLLTHDELTTFLHEFGHSLHGILAEGRYGSLTGTSVDHDFVELPSQIMENWAYEPEYLKQFARHYKTGEVISDETIQRIVDAMNYHAAYLQVRQLSFGYLDMAWHTITSVPTESSQAFEQKAMAKTQLLPPVENTMMSTTFSHIFTGGYAAGYYSYKWAEVLEADAFSLFKEKGIFNTEVAASFRNEILSKGSSEDEATLYRNFRGHDPEPKALLEKLGIISTDK